MAHRYRIEDGRVFDLAHGESLDLHQVVEALNWLDRARKDAEDRLGGWVLCWMAPLHGGAQGSPEQVFASDLDRAFRQARAMWPDADGWRCLGTVDPADPEVCVKGPYSGATQIVTSTPDHGK